jgi:membrane-associated phospholipid phosphatase
MDQWLHQFDRPIMEWVQSFINPGMTMVMEGITFLGSTIGLISLLFISVIWMLWKRKRWEALFTVIAIGTGQLFNKLLKGMIQRPRPDFNRLVEEAGYSFPSGHSMVSLVFYGMVGLICYMFVRNQLPKLLIVLVTVMVVLLIGISRIYLGVHYPSDVLGGFIIGGIWLAICYAGLKAVLKSRGTERML